MYATTLILKSTSRSSSPNPDECEFGLNQQQMSSSNTRINMVLINLSYKSHNIDLKNKYQEKSQNHFAVTNNISESNLVFLGQHVVSSNLRVKSQYNIDQASLVA